MPLSFAGGATASMPRVAGLRAAAGDGLQRSAEVGGTSVCSSTWKRRTPHEAADAADLDDFAGRTAGAGDAIGHLANCALRRRVSRQRRYRKTPSRRGTRRPPGRWACSIASRRPAPTSAGGPGRAAVHGGGPRGPLRRRDCDHPAGQPPVLHPGHVCDHRASSPASAPTTTALAIREMKRFIMSHEESPEVGAGGGPGEKVAIIGAGPAASRPPECSARRASGDRVREAPLRRGMVAGPSHVSLPRSASMPTWPA